MFSVEKENALLGATVSGLDLTAPLQSEDISALGQTLAEHQVLFFRDQPITHENHRNFGKAFGELQYHPSYPTVEGIPEIIILDNDRENPSKIDKWHTDMSFAPVPPFGSILVGRVIPEKGGDTMFSSLAAAYDDLPESMKSDLENLTATHSYAFGFKESLAEPGGAEKLKPAIDKNPDVVHPVIRTHPVTGRKMVFVNLQFTSKINELSEADSREMINWLCDHMVQDKYVYRFSWKQDSIAFWDNRAVMHVPVNDYWPLRRRVERVTINDIRSPF